MIRFLLIMLLLGGCLLGCNSDPRCRRETALLRSEILDLEDKYYMVKAQRDDAIAALEGEGKLEPASRIRKRFINESIPENEEIYYGDGVYSPSANEPFSDEVISDGWPADSSSQSLYAPGTAPRSPTETLTPGNIKPRGTTPRSTAPTPTTPRSRESGNPTKSLVEPDPNVEEIPSKSLIDPPNNPANNPATSGIRSTRPDANKMKSEQVSSSSLVTEIVIDKTQTSIKSKDGDLIGIVLCLVPRDANGRSREVSGELTVSVVDPSATGSAQRLGIWKFMPIELELFYESVNDRKKMVLDLPFEDAQPEGKEVVVMVRFQIEDGRVLETTSRIKTNTTAGGNASPPIKIDHGDDDLRAEKPQWRPVR